MTKPDAVKAEDILSNKGIGIFCTTKLSENNYYITVSIPDGSCFKHKVFFELEQVTRFLEE